MRDRLVLYQYMSRRFQSFGELNAQTTLNKLVPGAIFIAVLSVFGATRSNSSSGNPFSESGFMAAIQNLISVIGLSTY